MKQYTQLVIEKSPPLNGQVELTGAKNAVLVIMASLILTKGESILSNVPFSTDVRNMIILLQQLGAQVKYVAQMQTLYVDTSELNCWDVEHAIMKKMRASILVMGPLLARFGKANIALPGGCTIGSRPIDLHLSNFEKMGVVISECGETLNTSIGSTTPQKIVLDYPSVGATENVMMLATCVQGKTKIINAALEPEVLDLIKVLQKMGAQIQVTAPATIEIEGGIELRSIEHTVINDRLEAGALLLAAAITGGTIDIPQAPAFAMEVFLQKLSQMGHHIQIGANDIGVSLRATKEPKAVSFKTGPYPQFPTDLQAPMMAAQVVADGVSIVEETVFENRLMHVRELQKMGAEIKVLHDQKVMITGVEQLYGCPVIAPDIRASCALVLAGLVAQGNTVMTGVHHWQRAYDALESKLQFLGALIELGQHQMVSLQEPQRFFEKKQ
ncbi:MAG: UDP-N-acetylglucosamine 1-carboxyvinyltransferase [Candidatus Dependentiae bacterium]